MVKLTLFTAMACLHFQAWGQSADTIQRIDQLFSRWNNATPGGSVAIERGGKMIYHKAFGLADLEHNVPNKTETIFEAGSVSKQFTAMAILLLANEGKLTLQDDVRKFVPELPTYPGVITIQQLINHTSGLKDWGVIGGISGWPRTTRVYTLELALQIICRQKSLNFFPGTEYSYSNSNYSLLVTIVERVSKQSLADFTRTRLFEPAGMKNTQWRDNFREIVPNRAVAYARSSGQYIQEMPFENIHGHGGLLTTTQDLITWNHQLATHEIGGDDIFKKRIQGGKLSGGREITYAAGLVIGRLSGFTEISHTGATAAYRAVLLYYPQKKLSIAILSNDGNFSPGPFGTRVAEVFLGKTESHSPLAKNVTIPEESLKRFEGIYKSVRGFDVMTITYAPGKISQNNRTLNVLHPDTLSDGRLYWIMKKPGQILLKNPGDTNTYVKMKSPAADTNYLKSLTGKYVSAEADVTYLVELRESDLWINNTPHGAFKLSTSFYDGFLAEDMDLYEFKRNKKGIVEKLELSTSRAERLPFNKLK